MPQNKESVYDSRIAPLMQEILRICKEHDIPMVAVFQFKNSGYTFSLLEGDSPSEAMMDLQGVVDRVAAGEPAVAPEPLVSRVEIN